MSVEATNLVLTEAQKRELLQLARSSIATHMAGLPLPPAGLPELHEKHNGVFVSLHIEDRLRGCIGYVEGLRSYVHRKGLQDAVVFAGFVPDEELPAYYAACDAFAIPSKFETQALVVLEAMASGKPVAGANFRAIPEFVRDGENGYLFEPGDVEGAAGAISRCLDDRDRMSHSARATAERYTIASCAERLLAVYRRLLNR